MDILLILIPIILFIVIIAIAGFFWALKNGQYDDLSGDSQRLLFEDKDNEN